MKRTNERRKWKNEGRGSLRTKNRIIKPGQVFEAFDHEIPQGARDIIVPFGPDGKGQEPEEPVESATYNLKEKSRGWFDVTNEAGKVLNEKGMRRTEALELIKKLESV